MAIRTLFLEHKGGFYHYRVHEPKTNEVNSFSALRNYLYEMFHSCPDDYFNSGPRSSVLKFRLPVEPVIVKNHEVSGLVKCGLKNDRYKSNHSKVQMFMLENDKSTIAVEVPIWLMPNELDCFGELIRAIEPLSGHIDVLRVEDGKIYILDYKPNAVKEKYAATQVFFYALMLSRRTGIDLSNFICGYFDDEDMLLFKPDEKVLGMQKTLSQIL